MVRSDDPPQHLDTEDGCSDAEGSLSVAASRTDIPARKKGGPKEYSKRHNCECRLSNVLDTIRNSLGDRGLIPRSESLEVHRLAVISSGNYLNRGCWLCRRATGPFGSGVEWHRRQPLRVHTSEPLGVEARRGEERFPVWARPRPARIFDLGWYGTEF